MSAPRPAPSRLAFAFAAIALFPANFVRTPKPERPAPETILAADPGDAPEVSPVPIPGSGLVRGKARVLVRAPIDRVREVVLDFPHYPDFMPHYEACRVLGKTPSGGSDVYMRVEALHGALKMWARVEIGKSVGKDGVETYEARFREGNVRKLESAFRMHALDAQRTVLDIEVFLDPKLPVPDGMLNKENLDGARQAALAYKARSEGKPRPKG
jgi:ribosome-associated toxin RatA of RatAB toxin-antitoxin module